jgi:hypothetical protein
MTSREALFERCWPLIAPALALHEEDTREGVLAEVMAGRAQLWPGDHCAIITQCVMTDGVGSIHAWLGGGRLCEMLALRPGIEAWGRAMGCDFATIDGRKGWERLYRRFGYEPHEGLLRKAL